MRILSLFNRTILPLIGALALGLAAGRANAEMGIPAAGSPVRLAAPTFTVEPYAVYTGVAHVANGASLRDSGSATIRLRGMPSDANVIGAFLYWDFTSLTTPTSAQSSVIFSKEFHQAIANITKLNGTQIGTGGDPCWFGGSNFAFRANVTKWVSGNGDYIVTLLPGAASSTNGSSPWGPSAPTSGPLAEGASIVAIYTSSLEPTGTVLLYDSGLAGDEFSGVLSYNLDGVPTPPGISTSVFTELGADGQIGSGVSASLETAAETTSLNSTLVAGPGSVANDGDWNGTDGVPLNQLWDTHSHDVTGLLTAGLNNIEIDAPDDCLATIANVLTVR